MSRGLLIGLIIFFSLSFTALVGTLIWLMQHYPEYLGLPRPAQDSIEVIDTLALFQQQIDSLQQLLQQQRAELQQQLQRCQDSTVQIIQQRDSLHLLVQAYLHRDSLRQLAALQRADSLILETKKQFAQIYNQTNPQDVAKILEKLDDKDAAELLLLMDRKQAAKVLEAMDPERAASILALSTAVLE